MPPTIVSLIPSATEIVCALGLRDQLIGVSHECDYPEDVKGLPILSEPNLDPKLRGSDIDRKVRELVRDGLSIYRIHTELLEKLKPDLIITQDQCEVCAVSLKDVEKAVCSLTLKNTKICSLKPHTLEDIYEDFLRVGKDAGVPERARQLVTETKRRLRKLAQQTDAIAAHPRVVCLEWLEPPMVAGGWIPELVRMAGGEPLIVSEPTKFKQTNWNEIRESDPDIVVILPCGYSVPKTLAEMEEGSVSAKELGKFPAVTQGRCFICDGNAYFNRPGPRIVDSAEILSFLFHPDHFSALRSRYEKAFIPWR